MEENTWLCLLAINKFLNADKLLIIINSEAIKPHRTILCLAKKEKKNMLKLYFTNAQDYNNTANISNCSSLVRS